MDLGFIAHARRCEAKRLHRPVEIFIPILPAKWEAFTDGRLVNLDALVPAFSKSSTSEKTSATDELLFLLTAAGQSWIFAGFPFQY
jgi:hypothetical protein